MSKKKISKTTDLEELQYSVDAAGKMVNAATSMPSSPTLHRAAHATLNNATDAVEEMLHSSSQTDQQVGAFEKQTLDEVKHQFLESGHHDYDY